MPTLNEDVIDESQVHQDSFVREAIVPLLDETSWPPFGNLHMSLLIAVFFCLLY